MEQRPQTRKTNDNGRNGDPISLYPLTPEEALEGLLAVKPPCKDEAPKIDTKVNGCSSRNQTPQS